MQERDFEAAEKAKKKKKAWRIVFILMSVNDDTEHCFEYNEKKKEKCIKDLPKDLEKKKPLRQYYSRCAEHFSTSPDPLLPLFFRSKKQNTGTGNHPSATIYINTLFPFLLH